jgi:hypothetical protein
VSGAVYTPSRWGNAFHNLPHNEALGAGAAGVGKTLVLLFEPLAQIVTEHERCKLPSTHPHYIEWGKSRGWALHLRRTYKMLDQTIDHAKAMFPSIDPGVKWSDESMRFDFTSGYKYQFGHCHKPGDWQSYFSNEYTIICFDELIQFLESQYDKIRSRLRTSDPVLARMLKTRAMSNPVFAREEGETFEVEDPFWVRRRFVDPAPQGGVTIRKKLVRGDGTIEHRTRCYFPGKLDDNPNKEFVQQYEVTLLDQNEATRQALLHGNWYYQAGQYFTDVWNAQTHIVKPFVIPSDWPRFRSMDWGYKSAGCVHWWAVSPEKVLICEREWMFRMLHPSEVADGIKKIEMKWKLATSKRSTLTGPADTQLWEKRGERGKSKYEEFVENGVNWEQADKRSREANALKMYRRLKSTGDASDNPSMQIFDCCRELIRTIPMVPPGPKHNPDEPGEFKDDHAMDSAWYANAYASRDRKARKRPSRDEEDDYKKRSRRGAGRYGYGQRLG